MDILNVVKSVFAAFGCFFGFLLGGIDGVVITLIGFVVIDYVTGVTAAVMEKKLSSEQGWKGIIKKILIFLVVALANLIDENVFKGATPIRDTVIFFYIANEGISILENVTRCGVPFPQKLIDILTQIQSKETEK